MQLAVLLIGKLKGMGYEAACEFVAKRQLVAESGKFVYSEMRFLNPPTQCPDGDYVATFEPFTLAVKRRAGSWLIGQPLVTGTTQTDQPIDEAQRRTAPTLRALKLAAEESSDDPQN